MGGLLTQLAAFDSRDDLLVIVARVLLLVLPILMLVPGLIWWERRLLSWMQDRIGPNRVATVTWSKTSKLVPGFLRGKKLKMFGLLQPIADGVKLFFKEDVTPANVDKAIYFMAPAIALFPAFAIAATMPWGPTAAPWFDAGGNWLYPLLTPVADVNIGVLYLLAVSSLGVYGIVLAGYASNNKYSLMGGLRASAQLISYELAMGMSLACIVLASGSLRMSDMVRAQEGPLWGLAGLPIQNWFVFTPYGFLAAVIFVICIVAETNRAPFDLPEAENELIAGYHTEYSSMKFAVFFMGEYAAMFLFSGVFAVVFLGGYHALPVRWDSLAASYPSMEGVFATVARLDYLAAPLVFLGKIAFGISVYVWLRATLPRLRYDQLMSLGWRSLLPLAVANFMAIAIWITASKVYGLGIGWLLAFASVVVLIGSYALMTAKSRRKSMPVRTARLVEPAPGVPS